MAVHGVSDRHTPAVGRGAHTAATAATATAATTAAATTAHAAATAQEKETPPMSFWASIETKFSEWFGILGAFLRPAFDALVANGGTILIAAAQQAVAAVAADPSLLTASGTAKRNAAATRILATLEAQGLTAVLSAINLAIEVSVAALPHKP